MLTSTVCRHRPRRSSDKLSSTLTGRRVYSSCSRWWSNSSLVCGPQRTCTAVMTSLHGRNWCDNARATRGTHAIRLRRVIRQHAGTLSQSWQRGVDQERSHANALRTEDFADPPACHPPIPIARSSLIIPVGRTSVPGLATAPNLCSAPTPNFVRCPRQLERLRPGMWTSCDLAAP